MKCPNCGCEFAEGSFCPECGTRVEAPQTENIIQQEQEEDTTSSTPTPVPVQTQQTTIQQPEQHQEVQGQANKKSSKKSGKKKTPIIIGIIVVIIICVLGIVLFSGGDDSESSSELADTVSTSDVIELTQYLGYSEEELADELGFEINSDGMYPSMDNCNFMCIDKVEMITIDADNPGDDRYSVFGIRIGTKESDIPNIIDSDFEYSDKNSYDIDGESFYWYDDLKTGGVLMITCENNAVTSVSYMSGDGMAIGAEINSSLYEEEEFGETEDDEDEADEEDDDFQASAGSAVEDEAYMEYVKNYLTDFNQVRAADLGEFTDEELLQIYNDLMDRLKRVDKDNIGIEGMRSILSTSEVRIMSEETAETVPDNMILDLYEEMLEHENDTDGAWLTEMREMFGLDEGAEDNDDYIIPDSNTRYLSASDLSGLSKDQLRIARNEIYARHGRMFDSADLDEYFRSKSWYNPTIPGSQFSDNLLNDYEKKNAELIRSVENN